MHYYPAKHYRAEQWTRADTRGEEQGGLFAVRPADAVAPDVDVAALRHSSAQETSALTLLGSQEKLCHSSGWETSGRAELVNRAK